MRNHTDEQLYINNIYLKTKDMNSNTLEFYHELIDLFKTMPTFNSTSKKLALRFGVTERTIQRYVKTLKHHHLLHVRPHWNNDNPDKKYIEYNTYSPTPVSDELQEKAKNYVMKDKNVYFRNRATT